jgi:acyl dehydratase
MRQASPNAIFNRRVVFGGINLSMVIGLASQDTAEQCVRELGLTRIKLSHPVFHGDTLYAYSEVLAAEADPAGADSGVVTFRHYGVNQDRKLCVQADRTVVLRRRAAPREALP